MTVTITPNSSKATPKEIGIAMYNQSFLILSEYITSQTDSANTKTNKLKMRKCKVGSIV